MTTTHFYASTDGVRAAIAADELPRQKPRPSVFTGRIVFVTNDGDRAVAFPHPGHFSARIRRAK